VDEVSRVAKKTSFHDEVGQAHFFIGDFMPHPLVPQIIELANPVAEALGLELVGAVFHTNQHPPVLRIDIRNSQHDTGLEDCERMSRALETTLEATELMPDAYVLEISSPGISQFLTHDRDFISFKGFPVTVITSEPYEKHVQWMGKLVRRDQTSVVIYQKGRTIEIPRHLVTQVQLSESEQP
jgi:ribosome maturation factor RimP